MTDHKRESIELQESHAVILNNDGTETPRSALNGNEVGNSNVASERVSLEKKNGESSRIIGKDMKTSSSRDSLSSYDGVVITPAYVTKLKKMQDPMSSLYNKLSIQLFWRDLTFTVKASRRFKKFVKTILFPMTGYANPGETLAIMGPSGSGKTSLLNILARRVPITGGEVLVNGELQTKKFKSVSAYVTQDDILNGHLTVIEVLLFTAALRLPTRYPLKEKFKIANDIIDSLGLRRTRRTTIGIPGISKGISGGERKRVSIAVELLTSPSVLFVCPFIIIFLFNFPAFSFPNFNSLYIFL